MIKISLNLPTHRLDFNITKRRNQDLDEPLLPKLGTIKNLRAGSKVSRYFSHIFGHKNMRKLLGANLAVAVFATSLIPTVSAGNVPVEETIVSEERTILTTERAIQYPTEKISITQGFRLFHPGIDLDGITGDPIRPIMAGKVEAISRSKYAYGNAIIISHGNELTSLYAHLSKILVEEGQNITTDTVIGEMGATGRAFGDHLHLEIRDHERPINPASILPYPKI
jgi:murein DD-endopeptidase MepM/ murein hydrolase activator NlpD